MLKLVAFVNDFEFEGKKSIDEKFSFFQSTLEEQKEKSRSAAERRNIAMVNERKRTGWRLFF